MAGRDAFLTGDRVEVHEIDEDGGDQGDAEQD